MTSLSPSNSQNISVLAQFSQINGFPAILDPSVYEYQDPEDNYCSKICGYQKPKHRWMAKDQSMTILNPTNDISYLSAQCPESSEGQTQIAEGQHLAQTQSNYAPIRNGYIGFSPSASSSAPGTIAMPSSLTNTSSSPSNHTPPHSRNGLNAIYSGSPCNSSSIAETEYAYQSSIRTEIKRSENVLQMKRRRGRPPKNSQSPTRMLKTQWRKKRQSKSTKTVSLFISSVQTSHSEPMPVEKSNCSSKSDKQDSSQFEIFDTPDVPVNSGGLKIRLRRDNTINEPICGGKKARMRKTPSKTTGVFRIVESWCDADAPGGDLSHRAFAAKSNAVSPSSSVNLSAGSFHVGDLVWAKLAGYPYWPSRITALWARTAHHLAQVSPSPQNTDTNSLSVLSTPADPSLASGFTARVDWFAWDQCSYLSCAKLFPFLESFDKLYNPRTRVKGYTEAVKMAKATMFNSGAANPNDYNSKQFANSVDYLDEAPLTSIAINPHNSDAFHPKPMSHSGASDIDASARSNAGPLDLSLQFTLPNASFSSETQGSADPHTYNPSVLNLTSNANELYQDACLPDLGTQGWEPLPQLDISGFGDIISHVPTFSEDEDDTTESVANQLKIHLNPIA